MMPYGAMPVSGHYCSQCGCAHGPETGVGQQTWPGTFAQGAAFPNYGTGMGCWTGPGMGMGFGNPSFAGMGYGWPGFGGQNFAPANFAPPGFGVGGFPGAGVPTGLGYGLGGMRRWGGTYSPQFMTTGLPTDDEITEMIYDVIDDDPLIPYDAEINVDTDAGTVNLTGTVPTKQIKHAAGDDAWWIPGVDDIRNDLQVVSRRPSREGQPTTETTARPQQMRERVGSTARR